ncbi:MAG: hypothetical protein B7Z58_05350 [Acidiphilium sp. 37-64-53]|nr:MAG: hypothetical protein B7Z58_05350 [Acidiphilium sp. 37-64-53]OZB24113.1 MAG: hypothetical protein B7X49_15210 [Acidiphilium sp. 34-64-41]
MGRGLQPVLAWPTDRASPADSGVSDMTAKLLTGPMALGSMLPRLKRLRATIADPLVKPLVVPQR